MTTAQANSNLAFIKCTPAKLGRTNGARGSNAWGPTKVRLTSVKLTTPHTRPSPVTELTLAMAQGEDVLQVFANHPREWQGLFWS
jgi:hypothetical protein